MKQRVLQYGRLMPSLEKQLAEAFDVHRLVDEADPKEFLAQRGGEFTGLATQGFADAALIAALPKLKVISSFGVGVDKIDLKAAAERGIPVGNTPDVLNDCVADLAIGLMIDVARGIGASERYLRAGSWPKGAYPLQRRMSGKKLGILGLGRIGHAIAKRALAFDMDIRYHNRRPVADTSIAHEPSLVDLAIGQVSPEYSRIFREYSGLGRRSVGERKRIGGATRASAALLHVLHALHGG